jgi:energy-coupling factor transporter ATP-binding protein EcfA2
MYFKEFNINQWQQFENININFENRLTVLTGANGSGKTTILKLLSKHQGWKNNIFAVPQKNKETGIVSFIKRLFGKENISDDLLIGSISYSDGSNANLTISKTNSLQYDIEIQDQRIINCFYIPSHRSIYKYRSIINIPVQKKTKKMAFNEISETTKKRYVGGSGQDGYIGQDPENNSFLMKSTLISWAIQGYGNQAMSSDQELIDNYEGFKKILKIVLPKTLGFENFEIRNMEIIFICNNGNDQFLLETASGGIGAIIDIAWQIYMFSTEDKKLFTVIIDEIENHLHPIMQRSILPNLLEAFPNVKFIISTHSPLVVGSVKDSTTYALKYNDNKKIQSHQLNFQKQTKNAIEILDEVLGVSFTMPIWVENELEKIISKFSSQEINENSFIELRKELSSIGLEKLMPFTITKLLEGQ